MLPKDPVMLLSYVNTQLRDKYPNLDELAAAECTEVSEIVTALAAIDYSYDAKANQFT